MKDDVLMICYSRTGTTSTVARLLAAMTGWQLALIEDVAPRSGWTGDIRCILDSLLSRKPPYRYAGPPPGRFDHVVLMSPIWMGRMASPMRSYLQDAKAAQATNSRLPKSNSAIFLMSSRGGFRGADEMAGLTGHAPWPVAALEEREVLTGQASDVLEKFAENIQALIDSPRLQPLRPHWLSPREA